MRRFRSLAHILAVMLLTLTAYSQSLPTGVQKVTSAEGITEYRLANGLRVLLFPDPSKSTITVNMTYLVGSLREGSGERGMAHLLEHMLFKGSTKHTNIPQELTEHGSRPNGTTSYDRTNYFETFQATDENLKWALDLESDRMVNSFIRKSDLDSEMTVVRNEFEASENNPTSVLMQRAFSAAYLWHPYGRAVIGNRADIENVPIDKLLGVNAFDLNRVLESVPDFLDEDSHTHNEHLTSVSFEVTAPLDATKFQTWIGHILQTQGANLLRTKGILAVAGDEPEAADRGGDRQRAGHHRGLSFRAGHRQQHPGQPDPQFLADHGHDGDGLCRIGGRRQ